MIFLALLVPLAIYLLVLGFIHRRPAPLMVSGTWDFLGLVFAVSGFLVLGGPAILTGLHENWRYLWIFGRTSGRLIDSSADWSLWVVLAALYFLVVVGVCAWQLVARAGRVTAIYNVDLPALERALAGAGELLGLQGRRSGNLYLLTSGPAGSPYAVGAGEVGVTAEVIPKPPPALLPVPAQRARDEPVVLEVDPFPFLRHVTLRWEAVPVPLRQQLEEALADRLADTPTAEHDLGGWLQVLGLGLLSFSSLGCVTLQIVQALLGR